MSLHNDLELTPNVVTRAVTARVTRQFSATIETVFDAWLDPVTAGSFLFATEAGEVERAEIDARIGGCFRFVRRENGTQVRRVGTYVSIDRPYLLAFSFSDSARTAAQDRVIIEFASVGLGSLLVLTHEMGLESYAERHRVESEWKRRLGMLAFLCPIPWEVDFPRVQPRSVTLG
ncbi:MAG TPA: SRPBCC domain-containing protein [Steroidobacteraceae bacterium]|nr:SRPBCC domain-containing protein [Steroidobacteraceae bacterium]